MAVTSSACLLSFNKRGRPRPFLPYAIFKPIRTGAEQATPHALNPVIRIRSYLSETYHVPQHDEPRGLRPGLQHQHVLKRSYRKLLMLNERLCIYLHAQLKYSTTVRFDYYLRFMVVNFDSFLSFRLTALRLASVTVGNSISICRARSVPSIYLLPRFCQPVFFKNISFWSRLSKQIVNQNSESVARQLTHTFQQVAETFIANDQTSGKIDRRKLRQIGKHTAAGTYSASTVRPYKRLEEQNIKTPKIVVVAYDRRLL